MLDVTGNLSEVLTASYSRSLPYNASLYATVFHDFGTNRNTGLFVGFVMMTIATTGYWPPER